MTIKDIPNKAKEETLKLGLEYYVGKVLNTNESFSGGEIRRLLPDELEDCSEIDLKNDYLDFIESAAREVQDKLEPFVVEIIKRKMAIARPSDMTNDDWCKAFFKIIEQN